MNQSAHSEGRTPPPVREAIARRVDLLRRKPPAEAHGPRSEAAVRRAARVPRAADAPVPPAAGAAADRASARGHAAARLRHASAAHAPHGARARARRAQGQALGARLQPRPDAGELRAARGRACGRSASATGSRSCWSAGASAASSRASWPSGSPEIVAKVITMGTPFSGSPYANNAWRAYELVTGHSVEQPPVEVELAVKPPVETVALWSPRDGIVAPRSACGRPASATARWRCAARTSASPAPTRRSPRSRASSSGADRSRFDSSGISAQSAPWRLGHKRAIVHCIKRGP